VTLKAWETERASLGTEAKRERVPVRKLETTEARERVRFISGRKESSKSKAREGLVEVKFVGWIVLFPLFFWRGYG
jgi:hypothetical protein